VIRPSQIHLIVLHPQINLTTMSPSTPGGGCLNDVCMSVASAVIRCMASISPCSATIVNGVPTMVYPGLCTQTDWPACDTGFLLAIALPANHTGGASGYPDHIPAGSKPETHFCLYFLFSLSAQATRCSLTGQSPRTTPSSKTRSVTPRRRGRRHRA